MRRGAVSHQHVVGQRVETDNGAVDRGDESDGREDGAGEGCEAAMGAASMQHQPDPEAEAQQPTEGPNGEEGDHGAAALAPDMPDRPSRKSATTPVASQSRIAPISPPIAAKPYVAIVRPIGLDIASLSP